MKIIQVIPDIKSESAGPTYYIGALPQFDCFAAECRTASAEIGLFTKRTLYY